MVCGFFYGLFHKIAVQLLCWKKRNFYDPLLQVGGISMENNTRSRARAVVIELDALWTMRKKVAWLVMGLILLAMAFSTHAQQGNQKQVAFNEKAKSDFSKPLYKKQAQTDFSDADLSAQQMIAFFKNESNKLSKEISDLVEKTNPEKTSSLAANESDILHVAILKNKLEYFEVILKKWINEGEF
jgi:hypothetical protein